MKSKSFFPVTFFLWTFFMGCIDKASSQELREWTIMVFMNGDNDLEPYALQDFREMAKVSYSEKIKVVVQFDRVGPPEDITGNDWTQTLRFEMRKNIFPLPDYIVKGGDLGEQDMGDGKVLVDFVRWTKKSYPAKRYMLIIWDHGQGWRFFETLAFDGSNTKTKMYFNTGSSTHPAYKSVSHDATSKSELYNREIQDDLTTFLKGEKINLIGFDACLMSMVEAGYAFKGIANYMVASEELEPGEGWDYNEWLSRLMVKPTMDEKQLGEVIVASYKKTYSSKDPTTTLASVDLAQIENVATQIDSLSSLLLTVLPTQANEIKKMRGACSKYAPDAEHPFHHIDIVQFCKQIIANSTNTQLVQQAKVVSDAVTKLAVKANYFGKERGGSYGSYGLAIYFPASGNDYLKDEYEEGGYKKDNTKYPVEFVQRKRWADFLQAYFLKVP